MLEIIKSKRKVSCCYCPKQIDTKYRIYLPDFKRYCHLSCYYKKIKEKINWYRKQMKELNKQKYRKQMVIEGLS